MTTSRLVSESGKQFLNCKNVLEYEISFRSAIVLHMTNWNSFGHTSIAEIYVDIQAIPREKLTRSKGETGPNIFKFIRMEYHMQNAMKTCFNPRPSPYHQGPIKIYIGPWYHPLQMYFAGLPYIWNTENIYTIQC